MHDWKTIFATLAGVLMLSSGPSSAADITPSTEAFWTDLAVLDRKTWYVSDGWRNGNHQNCTWSRKAIEAVPGTGAVLTYLPEADGQEALCGEFQTKAFYQYGTFEAHIRANDAGPGLNAAFFLYTGQVHDQPHDEIDFELLTKAPDLVWLNRYVDGNDLGAGQAYQAKPTADGFHHLAISWEPGRLRWYVDGVLAREETEHIPTHPMKVYFSHWGSDSFPGWMGRYAPSATPNRMTVAQFSFTPLGQRCVFPGSITCEAP
ncbi:family 16 glycosylhydrolase [Sagittula sp. S175]|uniref:family 16 glycosylhydrolase n=1 Tax=Sagittula sp. S175 TaxID=3415129 RepID=UPI003C7A9EFE